MALTYRLLQRTFLAFAATTGCTTDEGVVNPARSGRLQARFTPPETQTPKTLDDDFVELARKIPGFGGIYYDETGTMTALLVDLNQATAARAELDIYVREKKAMNRARGTDRRLAVGSDLQFRAATYDFSTLKGWYDRLSYRVWASEGILRSDVDEVANRLRFTFDDTTNFASTRQEMLSLGIPLEAVILEVGQRLRGAGHARATDNHLGHLTDYKRPIPGAMKISMLVPDPGTGVFGSCTLGFNARMPGDTTNRYFITASHCSDSTFLTDNGPYYQRHQSQPWEFVGNEVWDPPLIVDSVYCRGAPKCRWSEATLVQYDGSYDHFGRLAYPWDDDNGTTGIWNYATREIVEDWGGPPFVGMELAKLGHVGGAREGDVTAWCVDTAHHQYADVKMLCQGLVEFENTLDGDSGGPVFSIGGVIEPNNPYHVRLFGILWASAGADQSVVSGIGCIRGELGNFITY